MAEKTQNPGQSTQTTAPKAPAGPIQAPAPGQNIELKVVVGQNIVLTAGFEQATPTVEGSKLIFEFANGGQVVLDFSDIGDAPLPNVVLADGSVLSVTDYLAVLGLEDIETAAGPDAGNQDSGGVGAYLDDAGDILDGVDKLGPQGPRNFGALLLEPIESAADDEDSVPLLLGPDSVLVEDEEMIEGIEEDEMPDLPGAVSGTVLDNVDWGVDAFGGVIGIVVGTETISVGASTTVYWAQDGTFLGTDGTGAAASLLVNGDGTYTFTLLDNMLLGQGVQDEQIDLLATVQIIGIDTDDDTVSIPLSLSVQDDVPVVSAIDPVQLDDDALPGGIPGGVGDDVDAVNVSGTLGHDFGADGGSIAWLTDGAPEGFSYESADGTTLLVKQGDVVVLTLTLDAATGAYTVTQNAPIMHASGDDENNQLFTFGYQVTDGDGDTAKGSLSLNVDDDTPVVQSIETATVEDEEMPGGIDEVDSPEYGKVVNGSVVDNVNWGADGFGSLSTFSLGGDSFTAGQTVYWNQAGTFLGTLSTGAAASLLVNGDGTYTFTLLDNVLLGQGIQGEQINQLASLSLTGADKDGDPVTIGLNLDVKDDIPVVTTPTDVLTVEDEKMSGGNDEADGLLGVIDGSIVDNVNWGADGFGAASGFTVGGQSFAAGQTVFWAQNGGFLGTSGPGAAFLTVNTDGTYSFGLSDNMLLGQNIQGEQTDFLGEVTITGADADGDTVSVLLDLNVNDDIPTVSANSSVLVDDDAQANGNPGGIGDDVDPVNASGTLGHSFGADGGSIAWLTTGAPDDFSYESTDGTILLVKQGDVTVLTLTLDSATGAYSVAQNAPIMHAPGDDENNQDFTFTYRVTDGDGDIVDGTLAVSVDDDTPVLTEGSIAHIVDEDDIKTDWSRGTSPDDNNADGSWTGHPSYVTGGPAYVFGSLSSLVSFGADGKGSFGFTSDAIAQLDALHLFSKQTALPENGLELTYSVSTAGGIVTLTARESDQFPGAPDTGNPVFELQLNTSTGDYKFYLFDELIHKAPDSGADENFELRSGNDGATVDTLNFGKLIQAVDKDGDAVTLDGKFTVQVRDDIPEVDVDYEYPYVKVLHDETAGNQDDDTSSGSVASRFASLLNTGDDEDVAGSGAIGFARSGAAIVQVDGLNTQTGADAPALVSKYSLELLNAGSGLATTEGETITLSKDSAGRIVGTVDGDGEHGGKIAFAVAINESNGEVYVAQYLSLKHPNTSSHDESVDLSGKLAVRYTITDSDGDTVSDQLPMGSQVQFDDDGPRVDVGVIAAADALVVDETDLSINATANYADNFSTSFSYGADGPGATASTTTYGLGIKSTGVDSGLDDVATGQDIKLYMNGGVVEGRVGNSGGAVAFTVTVNGSGQVTLDQLLALKHPNASDHNDPVTLNASNLISLTKTVSVTDGDGDSARDSESINIGKALTFHDDGPDVSVLPDTQEASPVSFTVTYLGGEAGYNNSFGYYFKDASGTPLNGVVLWDNVKQEGTETVNLPVGVTPSQIGFFIIPNGENLNFSGSEADGTAVTFAQVGGKWTAFVGGTALKGEGNPAYFSDENLNSDGQSHVQDVPSGTNTRGGNFNWEDLVISVSSSDKDYDDVDMTLAWGGVKLLVKDVETSASGTSTDTDNDSGETPLFRRFSFDFGADGPAASDSKAFELVVMVENTGLFDTATGDEVLIKLADPSDPTTVIGYVTDGVTDTTVFEVTVDSDGTVTVTQERAVMHPTNNPHEIANLGDEVLYLKAIATDGDGDTATDEFDLGKAINFQDVGPSAEDDSLTVTLGGEVNDYELGNVLTNDLHEGKVDGAEAEVVFLRAGGDRTYNTTDFFADDLDTEVQAEGTYGFLTLDRYGNASYVLKDGFSGSEGSLVDNFNYQMKDADGDTDVANITVTIQNGIEVRAFAVQIDDQTPIEISATDDTNKVSFRIESSDGSNAGVFVSDPISGDVLDNDSDGLTVIGGRTAGSADMNAVDSDGEEIAGAFGTLTLHSDGTYDYTLNAPVAPESLANQTDSFEYQAQDLNGQTVTATLDIDILAKAMDDAKDGQP